MDTEGFAVHIGGEVPNFDPTLWIPKKDVSKVDRFSQLAVAAADEAVKDVWDHPRNLWRFQNRCGDRKRRRRFGYRRRKHEKIF